ncbi:MAG TPA: hypothetical protein VNW97_08485 [Candidatus Saccharimonadales bacterium]|jgi:hypothetical protein|nr:hypothetical protein [Candidatus Saccharimonadales bacterium]
MSRSGARFAPERVNAGFSGIKTSKVAEGDDSQILARGPGETKMNCSRKFAVTGLAVIMAIITLSVMAQEDVKAGDPTKKLGSFLGKWQSEGTFTDGPKATSTLECRWSPLNDFLICEQAVTMAGNETHQLTIYSCNREENACSFMTLASPGAKPASGAVAINGNVWTYSLSFEGNGKTTQIRTTNEFTNPRTEVFKVESSGDGGSTWKTVLQGTARKTGG